MSDDNNSITEDLAEIAKEENQLNMAVGRVALAIASAALFLGGLYTIFPDNSGVNLDQKEIVLGLVLLALSAFATFGAWRAHVVHAKLKNLNFQEKIEKQPHLNGL